MISGTTSGLAFWQRVLRTPLVLVLALFTMPVFAAPQVTVSIKPLQLIAAAITNGVTTPSVVWGQGQDPHHVSLRPSERRLLAEADVVLWIGPMLERPLAALAGELDASVVTVQDLKGLALIDVEGQPDPHLWVDTRNARLIASALAASLAELDPTNAARYRRNLEGFNVSLNALTGELTQRFTGAGSRNWAVYHHALRYLEREFQLQPPLMLADSENNAPGIRTALQVREQLRQMNIACMLTEPGVNHDEVLTMMDLPSLRLIDADVMGRGADAGDYLSYMRALTTTVSACLGLAP
jgi:zinc transport system substrate-binding protein